MRTNKKKQCGGGEFHIFKKNEKVPEFHHLKLKTAELSMANPEVRDGESARRADQVHPVYSPSAGNNNKVTEMIDMQESVHTPSQTLCQKKGHFHRRANRSRSHSCLLSYTHTHACRRNSV